MAKAFGETATGIATATGLTSGSDSSNSTLWPPAVFCW